MNKTELYNKIVQLDGLTNEEKSELLGLLRKQKKYGLVWEDKPEDVEERLRDELPVLIEDAMKAIISDDANAPNHILIEGDNLEALTSLAYTHGERLMLSISIHRTIRETRILSITTVLLTRKTATVIPNGCRL